MAPTRRATARTATLPARRQLPLAEFLPSTRSLALCLALIALAAGAYAAARETSVFAVHEIEIVGTAPALEAEVRQALAPELGRSLVKIGGAEIDRRLAHVSGVLSVRYDRSFPNTLRVFVTPERPVLLLRRGKEAWVVSARGRVISEVHNPRLSSLPRAWVPKATPVEVGSTLAPENGGRVAAALAPLDAVGFPAHVRAVRATKTELTLMLRSGLEVRLGDAGDLRLKLAVARRILVLPSFDPAAAYLDVSVPERPVVGSSDTQVGSTA